MKRVIHTLDTVNLECNGENLMNVAEHIFDIDYTDADKPVSMLLEQIGTTNAHIDQLLESITNIGIDELSYMTILPENMLSDIENSDQSDIKLADGQLIRFIGRNAEHQLLIYHTNSAYENPKLQSLTFMDTTHDYLVTEVMSIAKGLSNLESGWTNASKKLDDHEMQYVRSEADMKSKIADNFSKFD